MKASRILPIVLALAAGGVFAGSGSLTVSSQITKTGAGTATLSVGTLSASSAAVLASEGTLVLGTLARRPWRRPRPQSAA